MVLADPSWKCMCTGCVFGGACFPRLCLVRKVDQTFTVPFAAGKAKKKSVRVILTMGGN